MTEPSESELLELATPYALDAVSDSERAAIETRVAQASAAVAAFDDEVCLIRETMTAVSGSTAMKCLNTTPPMAHNMKAVVA